MKKTPISSISPAPGVAQSSSSISAKSKVKLSGDRRSTKQTNGARHQVEDGNGAVDSGMILSGLVALKKGDFSIRLPVGWTGIAGKVADTFNDLAELMAHSTEELSRISRVVGKDGRIQERLPLGHVTGAWS